MLYTHNSQWSNILLTESDKIRTILIGFFPAFPHDKYFVGLSCPPMGRVILSQYTSSHVIDGCCITAIRKKKKNPIEVSKRKESKCKMFPFSQKNLLVTLYV